MAFGLHSALLQISNSVTPVKNDSTLQQAQR